MENIFRLIFTGIIKIAVGLFIAWVYGYMISNQTDYHLWNENVRIFSALILFLTFQLNPTQINITK